MRVLTLGSVLFFTIGGAFSLASTVSTFHRNDKNFCSEYRQNYLAYRNNPTLNRAYLSNCVAPYLRATASNDTCQTACDGYPGYLPWSVCDENDPGATNCNNSGCMTDDYVQNGCCCNADN